MNRVNLIRHEFVEFVPEDIPDGVLYVSVPFATAVHKCCCGCGNKVVTPIDPTDWEMRFNGRSISLYPSIGNWGLDCQSHYWIRRNRVQWDLPLSKFQIKSGRIRNWFQKKLTRQWRRQA